MAADPTVTRPMATRAVTAGVELTGHPGVDAVLQAMANAAPLPLSEQIAQFEAAHRTLGEVLATVDEA